MFHFRCPLPMSMVRTALVVAVVAAIGLAGGCSSATKVAPAPSPEFYGLYSWGGEIVEYADDIEKSGIRWLRVGGWQRASEDIDRLCLLAAEQGFHLTPVLGLSKSEYQEDTPLEDIMTLWRERVRSNVIRYGPGGTLWAENPDVEPLPIRYWQIWNEPNIDFLKPLRNMTRAQLYGRLLKAAAEEIRSLDPGARIIAFNVAGGAATGLPSPDIYIRDNGYYGWRRFIAESAEIAGVDSFDIVGTHPYTQPMGPEKGGVIEGLEMLAETAEKLNFADKPVWFTEVGFPLEYPRNKQVRDEAQQAAYLIRLYAIAAAAGVRQIQPMYITDIIYADDNSRRSFGFFTQPGKWRQQAVAVQTMMRLIPHPRFEPEIIQQQHCGTWVYRFHGSDWTTVYMVWNASGETEEYRLPVRRENMTVTLVDMLGNELGTVEAVDGRVNIKAGEAPIYVIEPANLRR